jgi:DNA-binding MarR family transcriptional regulator
VGVDSTGIVWLRLLQLRRMRKEKYLVLGNEWLTQHGVDRFAKSRALRVLEKRGLIRIVRSDHRSPRVHIVRRAKRRVLNPQQRGAD